MSVVEIIRKLREDNIELSVDNGKLRLRGNKTTLGDSSLLELVRQNKQEIIEKLSRNEYFSSTNGLLKVPPNLIPADCSFITPEHLPLVTLKQADIDRIAATVFGGMKNIQDIYPLAPLQEGMLFHHVLEKEGDVYLLPSLVSFHSIEHLNRYVAALQTVINRHDILRSSIVWEGIPEPVQVVWRRAPVVMEQFILDPSIDNIRDQLLTHFNPRHYRLDLRQAPLWRLFYAEDTPNHRWLLMQLRHHLIGDLTSSQVLHREMEACLLGQADQLPPPVPFRNQVAQARSGVRPEEHESFFTQMLSDVSEPTAPFGLADVQRDGTRTAEAHRDVVSMLCQRLRMVTRALGVSAASVCHVAWAMVLARLSGREDVVFGTMMVGRMQGGTGADHAVGLFINALPLRIRLGDESVQASIRKTHDLLIQLMRHEHASLALAQRCSAVRAPAPLFTAMMNYRYGSNDDPDAKAFARSTEAWTGIEHLWNQVRLNYPFGLAINDLGKKWSVDVLVDESIDPELICTLTITALESLITALEQAPETQIRKLQVLPLSERNRLLKLGNGRPSAEPPPGFLNGLYDLVTVQAERNPDSIAIVEPRRELTYRQLVKYADDTARQLQTLGAGPETRVALLADRSAESLVGMLGILSAGAAYVPLDPFAPIERLASILNNASALALLTPIEHRERANLIAAEHATKVLVISEAPANDAPLTRNVNGDNAAYVIYTSGTTGEPKGVIVNHRSALNLVHAFLTRHDFVGHRLLMVPPLTFDASVGDVFPILAVGATLVLHSSPTNLGSFELQEFCKEHGVTAIDSPAALWLRWAEGFIHSRVQGRVLPGVTLMMFGGENVSLDQVRRFAQLTENRIALFNHYGPTEATVCATLLTTCDGAGLSGTNLPIGKPLPSVQVYVLDEHLQLVPRGVEGELFIGGMGVARGYLDDSELTSRRFLRDPFTKGTDARMYRTGDFVRWNSNDALEFLGRRDDQVKMRGFRIELGEIEACLAEHQAVREAVVLAREDAPGNKRLVAYYTTTETEAIPAEQLRSHVAAKLPEYMAPAAYVRLQALPLTPNGKLDRRALPPPESDAYQTRGYVAPVGDVETLLATIWADVLKLERVGRHDNFFELGGHSLLAIRAVSLSEQVGLNIFTVDVFGYPTVELLATKIQQARKSAQTKPAAICVRKGNSQIPLFMVHEGTGELLYVSTLAPHLDESVPIYGLPATSLNEDPLRTIEGSAMRFTQMIRSVQPNGPYRIAGWSFGGILAYEIATQLIGADQQVSFLGMLDTIYRGKERYYPACGVTFDEKSELLRIVLFYARSYGSYDTGEQERSASIEDIIPNAMAMDFPTLVQECRELPFMSQYLGLRTITQIRDHLARQHAHRLAELHYYAQRLPIPVHLFMTRGSELKHPLLGWNAVVPERLLRAIKIDGTHESMMQAPHVKDLGSALSNTIRNASVPLNDPPERSYSTLTPLQRGTYGTAPMYCVPAAGTSVTSFAELIEYCDRTQPIYGLQPRGQEGEFVPHSTVEAAADFSIQAINRLHPKGPLHLLGHSFGGWVAFEMAHTFAQTAREVASLTILDAEPPDNSSDSVREYTQTETTMNWIEMFELLLGHPLGIETAHINLQNEAQQRQLLHRALVHEALLPKRSDADILRGPLRTFASALRSRYSPAKPYLGSMQLVLIDDPKLDGPGNQLRRQDYLAKWKQWAPNLTYVQGPGNHLTVLKAPHVKVLAGLILKSIMTNSR